MEVSHKERCRAQELFGVACAQMRAGAFKCKCKKRIKCKCAAVESNSSANAQQLNQMQMHLDQMQMHLNQIKMHLLSRSNANGIL